MSVFSMLENAKIVSAIVPINATGAAQSGDLVAVKDCERCYIVIHQGAWAGGTSAVTLTQEASASGSSDTALAFDYRYEGTALTADTLTKTAVTSNTFNLSAANKVNVIEINPASLADGMTHIRVKLGSPGSNNDYVSAFYVLTGLKYQGDVANIPTAIT